MKSDIMQPFYGMGVSKMPDLPCSHCGQRMVVNIGEAHAPPSQPARLSGTAICRKCDKATGFELQDNMINFIEGKRSYGSIDAKVSKIPQAFFAEAEMCSRSAAPNAVAAMCRASIETMLNEQGFKGNDLKQQINLAAAKKALDQDEIALAHGSRLLANSAIHGGELILVSHIPSMLAATVVVLNKLANVPSVQPPP